MKTFEVELRKVSYITLTIEANDEDEALDKAWVECKSRPDSDDATWDVESLEEMK